MKSKKSRFFFTEGLLLWNKLFNKRQMPWKFEKDPYKIWLSEIILQQTRVEQGTAYYNRFIKKYPTIKKLAAAPETDVFKLWEGLGYYSRCKNLISTAKYISEILNAEFPSTYESILQLKGVGPYTAAAIASFAYNLPHAVIDGNVMRVLARYFGIDTAIDSTEGKKLFAELAHQLLAKTEAGAYNQAIMDFGAVVCKPQLPLCDTCPLSTACTAFKLGIVNDLPVKSKKISKKNRWLYYIIASFDDKYYVRKRAGNDIWQNLHEFILIETTHRFTVPELIRSTSFKAITRKENVVTKLSEEYRQQLTHQTLHGFFIHVQLMKPIGLEGYTAINKKSLKKLAFPRFITKYLTDINGSF